MKLRLLPALLAICVALIVSISIPMISGDAFAAPSASDTPESANPLPRATLFIPRQSPFSLSLQVNAEQLERGSPSAIFFGKHPQTYQQFKQLQQTLLANTGLNYRKEIRPWLGSEITLAVTNLDLDHDPDNGAQPGYLVAATTTDLEQASRLLEIPLGEDAPALPKSLMVENYKGIPLVAPSQGFTSAKSLQARAIVGDFVLFANDLQVLRAAVNQIQVGDLSLAQAEGYQTALASSRSNPVAKVYLDLPAFQVWSHGGTDYNPSPQPQTLGLTWTAQPTGLVADGKWLGCELTEAITTPSSQPVEVLRYLPGKNLAAFAGQDLAQLWRLFSEHKEENSLSALVTQVIAQWGESLDLDLAETFLSQIDGEYAVALLPPTAHQEWVVAFANPSAPLDEPFDELAETQEWGSQTREVGSQTITAWGPMIIPVVPAVEVEVVPVEPIDIPPEIPTETPDTPESVGDRTVEDSAVEESAAALSSTDISSIDVSAELTNPDLAAVTADPADVADQLADFQPLPTDVAQAPSDLPADDIAATEILPLEPTEFEEVPTEISLAPEEIEGSEILDIIVESSIEPAAEFNEQPNNEPVIDVVIEPVIEPEMDVKLVRAQLDQYTIIASSLTAMELALGNNQPSLVNDSAFKGAIAALPQPNQGVIYVNWQDSEPWLQKRIPLLPLLELSYPPLFNQLRSLTFSSAPGEENQCQGSIDFDFE